MSLYKSLRKTNISSINTKKLIAQKINKEFSKKETPPSRLNELLLLAYHFDIPEFEEMLTCFKLNNIWKE